MLIRRIVRGIHRYARQFDVPHEHAFETLIEVVKRTLELHESGVLTADDDGDIIFNCTLCENEEWWQQNYGPIWEAARWWHCGPLGLECPGF